MANALMAWIGGADLRAASGESGAGAGPIGQAVAERDYDYVVLLCNYRREDSGKYKKWLARQTGAAIDVRNVKLTSPMSFGGVYEQAVAAVSAAIREHGEELALTFHVSPGTSAMAAVWVILAKTRFEAELIQSSPEAGVETASVPFDMSAEFLPDLLRKPDRELVKLAEFESESAAEFDAIVHRCRAMTRLVRKARLIAVRSVPVLIMGESGTGKELLARAIHNASPRKDEAFVAVNCGAIPSELVEAELFGHTKGAFTGAVQARTGYLEAASGGSLFLDEIGELPLSAQVKLLRALQEQKVTRIGSTTAREIDVRVIAATNRDLVHEVSEGRFRADLFHRIAVGILSIPPIRDRDGDIALLVDHLVDSLNTELENQPGYEEKKLSSKARTLLYRQDWPGNVRELRNTLQRAMVWSLEDVLTEGDISDALLPMATVGGANIMGRRLGDGFDLQVLMDDVAHHYLTRAMIEAGGTKTRAASLLGLPSYQTFTNWYKKYVGGRGT